MDRPYENQLYSNLKDMMLKAEDEKDFYTMHEICMEVMRRYENART